MEQLKQTNSQEFGKKEDKISEMETEIAELKQQLNNTEQGNLKLIMEISMRLTSKTRFYNLTAATKVF